MKTYELTTLDRLERLYIVVSKYVLFLILLVGAIPSLFTPLFIIALVNITIITMRSVLHIGYWTRMKSYLRALLFACVLVVYVGLFIVNISITQHLFMGIRVSAYDFQGIVAAYGIVLTYLAHYWYTIGNVFLRPVQAQQKAV